MERLVGFGAVFALFCLSHTSAQHSSASVVVDDGRIGVGLITGGDFGPNSFSIGNSPGGRPKTQSEDESNVQDMMTNHKGQQEHYQPPRSVSEESYNPEGFNSGNTQLYPVKSLTNTNLGQGSNGGKKEAGQILTSAVIQNDNKHVKDNKKRQGNKQPTELDTTAIEAIFGNNGGNTGLPNTDKDSYSIGTHGNENIQIDAIKGGNFKEETLSINNDGKPGINVLKKGSGVNNENTGNTNAGYLTLESKDTKNNGASNGGVASDHGHTNSGYNSNSNNERWIWSR